ncbi:MAG: TspO protein [Flavobacteriales bacterium]|nr:TspO protein [Flavobacteriales bacterium]|tara:strand:+ start:8526 stop:9002 length:477 start_codon:yes stop_codon:yes gene_type:complete
MESKALTFWQYFFLFLIANFIALGIGGFAQSAGPTFEWYSNLNRAPWTPPGWVFGFAWTSIMICFAVYLAFLAKTVSWKQFIILYLLQWILNVSWNPIFFAWHSVGIALIVIVLLAITVSYFLFKYAKTLKFKSLFIFPYFIWLLIAISLNAYVFLKN